MTSRDFKDNVNHFRFELPFNIWCAGCGNHVGVGMCVAVTMCLVITRCWNDRCAVQC